jgi:hypothetical protein
MKKYWWLIPLALLVGWYYWSERPVVHGPGVLAPAAPVQAKGELPEPWTHEGYRITALARFELTARVLGTERYRFGREAELSPVDLALGWGPMSDEKVLDRLQISQGGRWYRWRARELPIGRREITSNSANMHLVPAGREVRGACLDVREGEVVRIRGYLVRVDAPDGWHWVSSLSRTDDGHGACELIWVESLETVETGT